VKILALTDIHGRKRLFKKLVDAVSSEYFEYVVVAGDLTYFEPVDKALQILTELHDAVGKPVFFVPGNCDDPKLLEIPQINGREIYSVHTRKAVLTGNLAIYGIGGSTKTPFNTNIEWSEEDFEKMLEKAWDVSGESLIMTTHSPIYGVMDEIGGVHVGSRNLRKFLDEKQPLLWITGHLHEYSNYTVIGKTVVVNPGPFMHGYYAIIEVSGSNVSVSIKKL